ncbi:IucA/IucC family C-terminal-domain containing protein [Bacillus sp. AK031]
MSRVMLSDWEKEWLESFRLSMERPSEEKLTPASELMEAGGLKKFLSENAGKIGSEDLKTASSLLVKRYAFLAVISLFSFSVFNKKLNVSPENVMLVDGEKNGLWMPGFYFTDYTANLVDDRDLAREEVVREVFRNHLFLLIESVKKVSKLSNLITWENVAIYIFWVYEGLLQHEDLQHARERMEEDFRWLIDENTTHLIGPYHQNPLARYYTKKQYVREQDTILRVRKTCCFSYKLEGGESLRCRTCPQTCIVKQAKGVR